MGFERIFSTDPLLSLYKTNCVPFENALIIQLALRQVFNKCSLEGKFINHYLSKTSKVLLRSDVLEIKAE